MPDRDAVRPDKDNRQSSVADVSVVEAADIGVELADSPADMVQAVVAESVAAAGPADIAVAVPVADKAVAEAAGKEPEQAAKPAESDRPADMVQTVVAEAADRPAADRAEQARIQVARADAAMRKHMNIPA